MKVTIVQFAPEWHSPEENRQKLTEMLSAVKDTDLIVLPEMFTTGFTMHPERVAEPIDGPTVQWLIDQAREHNSAIAGSMVINKNNCFYNRMIFATPDGIIDYYDKKHLFVLTQEPQKYCPGKEIKIVEWRGWRIRLAICFDLRFPHWLFNHNYAYDLLLISASWPHKRIDAWNALLKARSIENQAYVVAVNRVGSDPSEFYSGFSTALDYAGNTIVQLAYSETTVTVRLDKQDMLKFREKFPFVKSASK